ncbi:MAG: DUF2141 domain-containing protein [Dongiaceae bacterium]
MVWNGGAVGGMMAGLALLLAAAVPARAAALTVTVAGVPDGRGHVLVALCTRDSFLGPGCPYHGSAPARAGTTVVTVEAPPGRYALQAFHDANDNLDIDRNFLGFPTERMGFGNDAKMMFGPPGFEDAAITLTPDGGSTAVTLRDIGP